MNKKNNNPLQWIADTTIAQPVLIGTTSPTIFACGQYTDQNGKTWDFESMAATEISALFLAGQIAKMEIYKTWSENE